MESAGNAGSDVKSDTASDLKSNGREAKERNPATSEPAEEEPQPACVQRETALADLQEARIVQGHGAPAERHRQRSDSLESTDRALPCLAALVPSKVSRWLLDSGASNHMIGRNLLPKGCTLFEGKVLTVKTAKGEITLKERAYIAVPALGIAVEALVFPEAPAALSIGKLIEAGFTFSWLRGAPQLFNPDEVEIQVDVSHRVPYVYVSQLHAQAAAAVVDMDGVDDDERILAAYEDLKKDNEPSSPEAAFRCGPITCLPAEEEEEKSEPSAGSDVKLDTAGEPPEDAEDDGMGPKLPRGFDARRNVHEKDVADAYNPLSAYHLRTHFPKLKGCPVCQEANTNMRPHRRRKDSQGLPSSFELEKFGDLVTMDVITMERMTVREETEKWSSRSRSRSCLLLYDVYTGWIEAFDLPRHTTDEVEHCIRRFAHKMEGTVIGQIKYMHTDGAPEFEAACKRCGIKLDVSDPGKPQENSFIERQVQFVIRGTRASLRASGLPLAFWPYAAATWCFLRNHQRRQDGESPYSMRFPYSKLSGCLMLPFGAAVSYLAPDTSREGKNPSKLGPRLTYGILVGYKVNVGGVWSGSYHVVPYSAFA